MPLPAMLDKHGQINAGEAGLPVNGKIIASLALIVKNESSSNGNETMRAKKTICCYCPRITPHGSSFIACIWMLFAIMSVG